MVHKLVVHKHVNREFRCKGTTIFHTGQMIWRFFDGALPVTRFFRFFLVVGITESRKGIVNHRDGSLIDKVNQRTVPEIDKVNQRTVPEIDKVFIY